MMVSSEIRISAAEVESMIKNHLAGLGYNVKDIYEKSKNNGDFDGFKVNLRQEEVKLEVSDKDKVMI